jgi:uncharacterized membrane protein YdjX (TVP38/TMEM64 family)
VRIPSARPGLRLALLAAIITAVGGVVWHGERVEVGIKAALRGLGVWAPLAFIAAYALCAPLGMPGVALTLLGGALFGPVWGSLWSLRGATVGGSLAFVAMGPAPSPTSVTPGGQPRATTSGRSRPD